MHWTEAIRNSKHGTALRRAKNGNVVYLFRNGTSCIQKKSGLLKKLASPDEMKKFLDWVPIEDFEYEDCNIL